jgi:DNA repair exonuclease SbcCD ATPase subunit
MSEIIEKDGQQIEMYSAEEVEAQRIAAIEQYQADNPDKAGDLETLQETLKEKEEEIEKLKGKDMNFSNLRKQKEDAEKKIEETKKEIDEKINTVKREVLESVMKDHFNETMKAYTGGDDELKKKIEYHYKRLADVASTKEEVSNKLRDAYILATKPNESDALSIASISSGGVSRMNIKNQDKKLTPEEVAMGSKFGLTPEDMKKYGGQ